MPGASIPIATYRLQFNSNFRLTDATALVEYLSTLGITDVYASPILTSRKGSMHGYDVTDPTQVDPDVGTANDFEELQNELLRHGMKLILDIVPNHMAASSENRWWMDVLENGSESVFASYFDIDWRPPSRNLEGKVLLPVLGRTFGETLDRGELRLAFENGKFHVQYYESIFPLVPRSYRRVLKYRVDELKVALGEESPIYQEYSGIIAALAALSDPTRPVPEADKRVRLDAIRERLQRLVSENPDVAAFINQNVATFNGTPGDPASFSALEHLLSEQNFRLAYWQDPNQGINYRRFFAISDLVGIRAEDPVVFEATHDQIFRLSVKGAVRGVRVDHIDGLRDPSGYLNRLRERLAASQPGESGAPYIIVEKILSPDESLPEDWPISGTTGYEYLNAANDLFVCPSGAKKLQKIYFDFIGREMSFPDVVYEKKKMVMTTLLRVEMQSLGRRMGEIAARDRYARDIPRSELTEALIEITACFPVYRTYIRSLDASESAKALIERAVDEARARRPRIRPECFDFLRDLLTVANPPHILSDQREERLTFVMRWQQFTSPIVAKGLEDTALFVYYPLLSLNEVGGNPEPAKVKGLEDFANLIGDRRQHWPDSLNASSTHDTKTSEDVRARLNVLSGVPDEWAAELAAWEGENRPRKETVNGREVPDANEEYLIYQALVGLWPANSTELPAIAERLQNYAIKAIREAMVHTRWTEPNTAHEEAVRNFIGKILSAQDNSRFLCRVCKFVEQIAYAGMVNGLGQTLLKIACPGVPDFYQGSELWDRHLVDPDNRSAVDFRFRMDALRGLVDRGPDKPSDVAAELLGHWQDGRIKLYLIWKALACRRDYPELFREGEFLPLEVAGGRSHHIIAFMRQHGDARAILVIPRWLANLPRPADEKARVELWSGTNLLFPSNGTTAWRNVLTDRLVQAKKDFGGSFAVSDLLSDFPVALLTPITGA